MSNDNIRVSVIVPAYNEAEAIEADIEAIIAGMKSSPYGYEIIVVDDGSTDGTGELAKAMGVTVLKHPENKGVGIARTRGVKAARGDIIVMTDADNTYPNEDIPRLLAKIEEGYDLVIGARTKEAGTVPWLRKPVKTVIRKLAEYIASERIEDLNSGFRAMKKDIVMRYLNITPEGHSWVGTTTIAFLSEKRDVAFIPIDYRKRTGRSTFHPIADTYGYMMFIVKTVMYFKPLKVFIPVSMLFLTLGIIKGLFDSFVLHDFKESEIVLLLTGVLIGVLGLLADLIVKLHKRP
ncbi:MAG: glycosyltransferase family 2 protein [Candidatus Coatesbacteria bacterium]|nr:glycosyltransferase family 2 protein [Candidatus Coatesbacteria bacterium]